MIIWLASYPRSGNTLARTILYREFGIRTTTAYDDTTLGPIDQAIGHLQRQGSVDEMRSKAETFIVKTHELPGCVKAGDGSVYIVRDGRDVMVSRAHYDRAVGGNQRPFPELLADLCDTSEWAAHVCAWWPVASIRARYEDMVRPDLFLEMHGIFPAFFRRGVAGAWEDEMTPLTEIRFWAHNSAGMDMAGYQRNL